MIRSLPFALTTLLAKVYGLCLFAGLLALLVFSAGNWAVIALAVMR